MTRQELLVLIDKTIDINVKFRKEIEKNILPGEEMELLRRSIQKVVASLINVKQCLKEREVENIDKGEYEKNIEDIVSEFYEATKSNYLNFKKENNIKKISKYYSIVVKGLLSIFFIVIFIPSSLRTSKLTDFGYIKYYLILMMLMIDFYLNLKKDTLNTGLKEILNTLSGLLKNKKIKKYL